MRMRGVVRWRDGPEMRMRGVVLTRDGPQIKMRSGVPTRDGPQIEIRSVAPAHDDPSLSKQRQKNENHIYALEFVMVFGYLTSFNYHIAFSLESSVFAPM